MIRNLSPATQRSYLHAPMRRLLGFRPLRRRPPSSELHAAYKPMLPHIRRQQSPQSARQDPASNIKGFRAFPIAANRPAPSFNPAYMRSPITVPTTRPPATSYNPPDSRIAAGLIQSGAEDSRHAVSGEIARGLFG
jgi:hypothetical protein